MKLKKGKKAPDFTISDQDGNMVSLSDYKGKKVALFFYPQDNTPTCTQEACNLRDNFAALKQKGIIVLGVSTDNAKSHKKFETKYKLPFPLIADTSYDVLEKYGVWDQKKLFGREYMGVLRTTFVINEKGIIQKIFTRPIRPWARPLRHGRRSIRNRSDEHRHVPARFFALQTDLLPT